MIYGKSSMLICNVLSRSHIDLVQRSVILEITVIALNISLNRSLTYTFYFFGLSIK